MTQTVLVTGASGFIAKHIVKQALEAGHAVRAAVRTSAREDEVRLAVGANLASREAIERLGFVRLDLERDDGWEAALQGSDALIHTASPFPLIQPKDEADLIRPAVQGTLRALRAAHGAGVRRVVMTSSTVAVTRKILPAGRRLFDESDWSDVQNRPTSAYGKSKTLAERAAWDFVGGEGKGIDLTVINPAFVLGVPLDDRFGTSLSVIQRILRARDPANPRIGFPVVNVRDIAHMHVKALSTPDTIGRRIIGAGDFLWFSDMAEAIRAAFPARRIVTRTATDMLIRLISLFDSSVATILPDLGQRTDIDTSRAQSLLGMRFAEARATVVESARFLIERNLI